MVKKKVKKKKAVKQDTTFRPYSKERQLGK